LKIPEGKLLNLRFIDEHNQNELTNAVVLVTGDRHEPFYMLQRMVRKVDKLIHIETSDTVILMTAPKDSDYYKVVSKNPFGKEAFSENVVDFYRSKGYSVKSISTPMRFYVAHAEQSPHEATILWKFFHDTEEQPTKSALDSFIKRLRTVMDKEGNIDFKDKLIVITHK